jgi:hypothetical protein
MSAAKNKVRLTIKFLLVLSLLLPAVTTIRSPVGLKGTGAIPGNVLSIPAAPCESGSLFTLDRRAHFDSFDQLHTDVLILRQIQCDFAREFSSFIAGYNTRLAPRAGFAAIPIRASPCHRHHKFVINA